VCPAVRRQLTTTAPAPTSVPAVSPEAAAIPFGPALNTFQDVARQWSDAIATRLDATVAAVEARRYAVQSREEAVAYCRRVRAAFWDAMGGLPGDPAASRDGTFQTHGTLTHLGLQITKVTFESLPNVPVSGLLYRLPTHAAPRSERDATSPGQSDAGASRATAKRPAIVFTCGHYTQAKVSAEFQTVCLDLALHGFVVLVIDPWGQGERFQYAVPGREGPLVPVGTFEHSYTGLQCLLTGSGVARYFAWDAVRAVDILAALPEVDETKIGVTGNSGGGVQTTLLMLADERIAAAMPCTFICGASEVYRSGLPLDGEMCHAGALARDVDHADLLLGFAPKPLLVGAAAYDFFPIEATEHVYEEARRVYSLLGAENKIGLAVAPSLHMYGPHLREAAVRFFTRELTGTEHYTPHEITTLPEADLICSPTGQLYRDRPNQRGVHELNLDFLASIPRSRPATASEATQTLSRLLGPTPTLDATPIRPRYFDPKPAGDLTARQVYFFSEPNVAVAGTLLRRTDASSVGASASGASSSATVGTSTVNPAPRTWLVLIQHGTASAPDALQEAIDLARAGDTVFIFDPRGRGAVNAASITIYSPYDSWLGQEGWSSYVEMFSGYTTLASRVFDVRRAISFLEEFEGAAGRIAIRGHGIGALWGYLAAALDPRVRETHLTNMLPSYQQVADTRIYNSDAITAAMVIPGVLKHLDLPDLEQCFVGRTLRIASPLPVAVSEEDLPLKRNAFV
jgi:cephalosporin-C deacetylase-like acetyl esterase